MKRIPGMKQLEEVLRSSSLVAGGFLGKDSRILEEILEADASEVNRLGTTFDAIADRMAELTDRAKKGLGTTVDLGDNLEGTAEENRGVIICPWPHEGRFTKTVTTVRRTDTGESIRWSDLSIHYIKDHGFFEGRGAHFRLEPEALVRVLF